MLKTVWLRRELHNELGHFSGSLRPEAALTAMLQWRALTGYRGRSSGCAQTCAMACICGSLYSCRASPSRDALCSRLVRVLTVRKLSSCCGRLHPRFLQPHDMTVSVLALGMHLEQDFCRQRSAPGLQVSASQSEP